jgi:hypothetical protein
MGRKAVRMDLNILKEAANAIESHQDYGDPETNHRRIADLWNIYAGTMLNSKDVMMMMILVKVSRLMQTPGHRDSQVDIAGYAALLAEDVGK